MILNVVEDYNAQQERVTPRHTHDDITNRSWNRWPHWVTKRNFDELHDYPNGDITRRPFSNDDTWDFIAIQRALWDSHVDHQRKPVYLPHGTYYLSKPVTYSGYMTSPLMGDGMYQSVLKFVDAPRRRGALIRLYKTHGPPTPIKCLGFIQDDYSPHEDDTAAAIAMLNCNAIHLEDLWISGFGRGVDSCCECNDCYITGITIEYCNTAIYEQSNKWDGARFSFHILGCNFWRSFERWNGREGYSGDVTGVRTDTPVSIADCNFVGFEYAVRVMDHSQVTGCRFDGIHTCAFLGRDSNMFSNNRIRCSRRIHRQAVEVHSKNIVASNAFHLAKGVHPAVGLHARGEDVARFNTVSGNVFDVDPELTAPHYKAPLTISALFKDESWKAGAEENVIESNAFTRGGPEQIGPLKASNTIANNRFGG